jgi:hypothetical protein
MPSLIWRVLLIVLASAWSVGGAVHASVTVPQRSLRALGGRPVWVPICSRRGVNGSAPWFDGTSTAVMDQQACISPSWGTVTAIKLVFAAFDMPQQGEVDRSVTATGTAAVFVPGANTVVATGGAAVASGSMQLNTFPATGLGVNGISLGQVISSNGGAIAAGSYVTGVANSFTAGAGNAPAATIVTMNTGATAATANGQSFTFEGLLVPVKFGGRRNFLVEPGHDVVTSDPVGVELSPNTWFMVRTSASVSGTGLQMMDLPETARMSISGASGSFSEFDNRGTSVNDQTMTPVGLSNTGGGYWGPVAVLALVTPSSGQTAPGAVLVLGDSIAAGTGDLPDSLGLEGYIQRSFENNVPFITAARGSTTAFGVAAHGDGQYALSIDTGITDVLLEDGRNDIEQFGISASQLTTSIQSIAARYTAAAKRVWCFTLPPTTYSNDAWTSLANQAFPFSTNATGAAAISAGATTIGMATVANIAVGQIVSLNGASNAPAQAIAPGTHVVSVDSTSSSIVISAPTASAIVAPTKLYFGSVLGSGSPLEVQREAYNNFMRLNWSGTGLSCAGLIDVDAIVSDPGGSGKWRTDLGQASADGVHPAAVLHQAVINSGVLNAGRFSIP